MMEWMAVICGGIFAVVIISAMLKKHVVREYERGLLYLNGRFKGQLAPGAYRGWAWRTHVVVVDVRKQILSIPGQDILTADQAGIKLSLIVSYELGNPVQVMHSLANVNDAIYAAAQLALRKVVGSLALEELIDQRIDIGARVCDEIRFVLEPAGLTIRSANVKDVMLPAEMRKACSDVIRARKEGQAALERARGETAALRCLANTARLIEDNPSLLRLRALQVIESSHVGHTVVLSPETYAPPRKSSAPTSDDADTPTA